MHLCLLKPLSPVSGFIQIFCVISETWMTVIPSDLLASYSLTAETCHIIFFPLLASKEGIVNQRAEKDLYWQLPSAELTNLLWTRKIIMAIK